MTRDINIRQLATTIMSWLNYISAVGRDHILNEDSIKFPASEYLERVIDKAELEYGHPKLFRKRLDLFFIDKNKKKYAIELKYIKNGSTRDPDEKQRVFNDLMRLLLFLESNHKSYFLICGNQRSFIGDFQKINPPGSAYIKPIYRGAVPTNISVGFYTKWFSFDTNAPHIEIDLNNKQVEYKDIYDLFFKEYADPHLVKTKTSLQRPDKIKTSLVFLSGSSEQSTLPFNPSKIGVWEISKVP